LKGLAGGHLGQPNLGDINVLVEVGFRDCISDLFPVGRSWVIRPTSGS
jgi:hypothetical protein